MCRLDDRSLGLCICPWHVGCSHFVNGKYFKKSCGSILYCWIKCPLCIDWVYKHTNPFLVEEHIICLHPLICRGFNANFDGDQMGSHMNLFVSHMNLLSLATWDFVPTQDMLIWLDREWLRYFLYACSYIYNLWMLLQTVGFQSNGSTLCYK